MVITGLHVHAIVWWLFCTINSVHFCTPAVMLDIMAAEGGEIPMTMLAHLGGGGQLIRALWVAAVCVTVGGAPGFSNERALAHRRVLLEWREDVMCPVYTWWNSLEAAPVTRSLLFVAPVCHLAEFSDCVIVLHVSRAYAVMATGSGQPKADRTGIDFQDQV